MQAFIISRRKYSELWSFVKPQRKGGKSDVMRLAEDLFKSFHMWDRILTGL